MLCCAVLCGAVRWRARGAGGHEVKAKNLHYVCEEKITLASTAQDTSELLMSDLSAVGHVKF